MKKTNRKLPRAKTILKMNPDNEELFREKMDHLIELAPEATQWYVWDSNTWMDMIWVKPILEDKEAQAKVTYSCGCTGSLIDTYFLIVDEPPPESQERQEN